MKTLATFVTAATAAILLSAAPARAALRVVTATQDLASIAQEVGGDKIKIDALAKPNPASCCSSTKRTC